MRFGKTIRFKDGLKLICVILCLALLAAGCGKSSAKETTASEAPETTAAKATETTTAQATTKETETTTETTTTEETTKPERIDPVRFYFFGVDTVGYTQGDQNRSDIIMIMQFNPNDKTIKFVSILRDTQVDINGYPQKINGAYQQGGPELAMATVNENFYLDIHDYITMNFAETVIFIDELGGVDVELSAEEAQTVNSMVWWDIVGDGRNQNCIPLPEEGGLCHLDGEQALMFSRIRSIDNDYYRAGRQHRTLRAIHEKISNMSKSDYPKLINFYLSNLVDTSFTLEDILKWTEMGLEDYEISSHIVPDRDIDIDVNGGIAENGQWVWTYNFEAAAERIHGILADEVD